MAELENLVLVLARSLVEEPEKVEVSGTESDSRVDLEIRVAQDDMGGPGLGAWSPPIGS